MSDTPRIRAIIPAAGRSRRMGRDKQLLPVRGRPMLLGVVEAIAAAGVAGVAVVTRREILAHLGEPWRQVRDSATTCEVFSVINDQPAAEMIDSVRLGIAAWEGRGGLRDDDGLLVCPGDCARVSTEDCRACIATYCDAPGRIVIATHADRRGHPIIFPASDCDFVRSAECDAGLRALPRSHPDRITATPCPTRSVIDDVDTLEDYERLQGRG